MALVIHTDKPRELLRDIKKAIDDEKVNDWIYDQRGDFTYTLLLLKEKAWFHPRASQGKLELGIIGREDEELTKEIYAIYYGRFIEMLLINFPDKIITIAASPTKSLLT